MSALGYPTSSAQMHKRLESILCDDDYATLVACDGEHIVGFIGTRVGPLYESDGCHGQIPLRNPVIHPPARMRRMGVTGLSPRGGQLTPASDAEDPYYGARCQPALVSFLWERLPVVLATLISLLRVT